MVVGVHATTLSFQYVPYAAAPEVCPRICSHMRTTIVSASQAPFYLKLSGLHRHDYLQQSNARSVSYGQAERRFREHYSRVLIDA